MEDYREQFNEHLKTGRITRSKELFKISLFMQKGENSVIIAKHLKELKPKEGEPKKIFWIYC